MPTRPVVRVTRGGSAASSIAVTFAVASGGGSVAGGNASTDANGIATVGSWTLGTTAGSQTLTATVSGASGSPVTFSATAIAGPPSAIVKQAGDNQQFRATNPVPNPPSVRVNDQFGNPVQGVTVLFAVEVGGGVVTGANQVTDAGGIATVGGWTLGPVVGEQRLSATVQGQAAITTTFVAQAVENSLSPAADTMLSGGVLELTNFTVAAGRTVTVNGNLTIETSANLQIAGTIRGVCRQLTLDAGQTLTITGTVDNGCAEAVENPPTLLLIGRGSYELGPNATVTPAGDFEITNDPTLTDADFPPALAPPSRGARAGAPALVRGGGRAAANGQPCKITGLIQHKQPRGKDGNAGTPRGQDGFDAKRLWATCRGDQLVSGATIRGQHGGHGGKGTDNATTGSNARGGNGGIGGEVRFRSTGSITFDATNDIGTGDGGNGGAAESKPPQAPGARAPDANATGGDGARYGLFQALAVGPIIFPGVGSPPEVITLGNSGDGGKGEAVGADGMNATSTQAAQPGGHANARGGPGADGPDRRLSASGIVNAFNLNLAGGNAGKGGAADATAGKGGNGSKEFKNGVLGGNITAHGGDGGDADLKDQFGNPVGNPGDGGDADFRGGMGGNGFHGCHVPGPVKGGDGGRGGDGIGGAGQGGTQGGGPAPPAIRAGGSASVVGADGTTRVRQNAGNGGNGADGHSRGVKGPKGSEALLAGAVNRMDEDPNFEDGRNGNGCVYKVTFTVKSDPSNINSILNLTGSNTNFLALVTRESVGSVFGISIILGLGRTGTVCLATTGTNPGINCGSGSASGSSSNGKDFSAGGGAGLNTSSGSKTFSMSGPGIFDDILGEILWEIFVTLFTTPGGSAEFAVLFALLGPFTVDDD